MSIRVLIVDDHGVVRQGLRIFLSVDRDLEVVGEAQDGAEAIRLTRELQPDVVLMDLLMPGMDGVTATQIIRQEMSDTEVVVLTSVLEDGLVIEAMRAGAIGYLLKDTEAHELIRSIKAAAAGEVKLSSPIAARLVQELRTPNRDIRVLTEREAQVMELLARGKSNKEISQALAVSEQTVKTHVSHILKKLGLPSRTQAALYAIRAGLAPNR